MISGAGHLCHTPLCYNQCGTVPSRDRHKHGSKTSQSKISVLRAWRGVSETQLGDGSSKMAEGMPSYVVCGTSPRRLPVEPSTNSKDGNKHICQGTQVAVATRCLCEVLRAMVSTAFT